MRNSLRLYLERCGVVLPTRPDEVFQTVNEHPDLEVEILLWATFEFALPFADSLLINAVPATINETEYGRKLKKVLELKEGDKGARNG